MSGQLVGYLRTTGHPVILKICLEKSLLTEGQNTEDKFYALFVDAERVDEMLHGDRTMCVVTLGQAVSPITKLQTNQSADTAASNNKDVNK